jgi:hypothetical protein
MKVDLPKEILKGLKEKAKDANISIEAAATLILSEFVRIFGSGIYVGTWRSGDKASKKGMRYVVDWPFQPGLVKIPGDQTIDLERKGLREEG